MKSLQEIKDHYAVELGFKNWDHMFYDEGSEIGDMGIDEIANRWAEEKDYHGSVASLAKAAENAFENDFGIYSPDYIRKRITSPDNIVTL